MDTSGLLISMVIHYALSPSKFADKSAPAALIRKTEQELVDAGLLMLPTTQLNAVATPALFEYYERLKQVPLRADVQSSLQRFQTSPLFIQMALHYYTVSTPYSEHDRQHANSTAVRSVRETMVRIGLLERADTADGVRDTKLMKTYIENLKTIPIRDDMIRTSFSASELSQIPTEMLLNEIRRRISAKGDSNEVAA